MRRFDPGYLSLKRTIDDGDIGEVLLVHCVHRNRSGCPPPEMMMSSLTPRTPSTFFTAFFAASRWK